jgi:hypothetical protein
MDVTGYDPDERFYATRYHQGGRVVFSLDLSLTQIASLIPAPTSGKAAEGNRMVKEAHARAFGDYVREKKDWVAPALVLRAPDIFQFEVRENIGGTEFGVLAFPKLAATDLRILDGQHRILGIHLAIQGIADDLEAARSRLAAAKRNEETASVISDLQAKVDKLTQQRERFSRERTSLQVFVEDDQIAYKQMFFDIADNALGITSSVRARFDSRKIVNRTLEDVMKHSLLQGRVDPEQDRIGRSNPNLLGAKHVAELVRTLAVGVEGRIGKRLEDELTESALVQKSNDFFDVLLASFPPLAEVADGDMTPEDLRRTSLLGSTVLLRVLAGVYVELVEKQKWEDDDVIDFFSQLAPHMAGPATAKSIWIAHMDEDIYAEGAFGPRSRHQDLKALRDNIVKWALSEPDFLKTAA